MSISPVSARKGRQKTARSVRHKIEKRERRVYEANVSYFEMRRRRASLSPTGLEERTLYVIMFVNAHNTTSASVFNDISRTL